MSASTEVQRTLVKSPPELWAELSDPAALARHLSELGDVRITRTEPERAVDWEATAPDGSKASGRVEISPTGWGTRVTFSATRPDGAPAEPAPSESPIAQTSPGEPLAETDPFPDEGLAGEDDPIDDPLEEDDSPDDPYSDDDPYRDDDPYADDDSDDEEGDEVLVRADLASAHQRRHAPPSSRRPADEPRQGFFARLFGRARRPFPEPRVPRETVQRPAYAPNEDVADQLPPPELPSSMAMAEQVTLSYEDVGARPPASDLRADPLPSELAELDAATLARAHAAEQADGGDAGEIGEIVEPTDTQALPAQSDELGAAPDELGAAPVELAAAQADAPSDIAGELRSAEEVAAEQVTAEQVKAVLTSALDRLGAAHHRPFSRG